MDTAFTELIGCKVPIQLAGMGGMWTPELTAAVAAAGGLGMAGAAVSPVAELTRRLQETRALMHSGDKFGVNFLMPFVTVEAVEAVTSIVDVVEFFYDDPDPGLVETVHQAGVLAGWQIGSLDEALAAEDVGCDYIVSQGVEAGGHVRGTVATLELLGAVRARVQIPIVAAGGVSDRCGLTNVLAAGGDGVRVGTRFVACNESAAHPDYIAALLAATDDDTVLTEAYSVGWPNAPHRVLKQSLAAAQAEEQATVGQMTLGGTQLDIPRFNVMPPDRTATGNVAAMCMYAGQSVGGVVKQESAASIVADILGGG